MAERKKMLIGNSSEEMLLRETETGEDKVLRIDELYEQYKDKTIWLRLGATDQYGFEHHIWRPCKLGVFIDMEMPE
jgi:hypothetical protein